MGFYLHILIAHQPVAVAAAAEGIYIVERSGVLLCDGSTGAPDVTTHIALLERLERIIDALDKGWVGRILRMS